MADYHVPETSTDIIVKFAAMCAKRVRELLYKIAVFVDAKCVYNTTVSILYTYTRVTSYARACNRL